MIAALTSARSDWYLLEPVLKKIEPRPRLFIGKSHRLKELGTTFFDINYWPTSYFNGWFVHYKALILLGDRYETFLAAVEARKIGIPIIHIHAGEQTLHSPDNAYRTCITALASLCFAPTDLAAVQVRRINPLVDLFTVGAIGAEIAANLELYGREELEQKGFRFGKQTFLVTWNPQLGEEVSELIAALEESGAEIIWTYPGADPGYKEIIEKIEQTKFQLYANLGQKTYLSLAKQCTAVVGNSSSGIIEVPQLKTVVLNLGKRQMGREMASLIFNCEEIEKAKILYSLRHCENWEDFFQPFFPYYQPGTIQTIATEIMKRYG